MSLPQLAGAISSREFLDLREVEFTQSGFVYFCGSLDHNVTKHSATKGRVLGTNFPCGIVLDKDGNDLAVQMLWHTAVNGWLPSSIVGKAVPGLMISTIDQLRKRLAK